MGNILDFIKNNLWHVAPILICGAFGLAIIAERYRTLFLAYPIKDMHGFFDKLQDLVMGGKIGEAISLCDRYPHKPAAQVVKQALLRAHQPENLIEQGVELGVGDAVSNITKRTSYLATIANVATLLGLFGTIAGLIQSFEAVGHADAQQKSALLAAGISTAMNATMLGLAVAIPCMVAFSFLMNRQNRMVGEVDRAAVKALDILKQRYYAAESEALNPRNESDEDDYEEEHERVGTTKAANGKGSQHLRRVA